MDLEDGLIRCRMPLKEIGPACRTRAVLYLRGLLIVAVARLSTLTLQMRRQPVAGWSTEALSHKSVLRGWFTTLIALLQLSHQPWLLPGPSWSR